MQFSAFIATKNGKKFHKRKKLQFQVFIASERENYHGKQHFCSKIKSILLAGNRGHLLKIANFASRKLRSSNFTSSKSKPFTEKMRTLLAVNRLSVTHL